MQSIHHAREHAQVSRVANYRHPVPSRYLEHEKLKSYPKANIVLLRPSMCLMLTLTPDPTTLRESLPNFSETTHIFIPVTDCKTPEVAESGSHWSLLLVSIIDGVAFHYDSLGGANDEDGVVVAKKLGTLLGKPLRFVSMDDCPLQENGSDCGVFVCLLMQHLLFNRLLKVDAKAKVPMSMAGKEVNASHGRREMLRIINNFRDEAQKRNRKSWDFFTLKLLLSC